MQQGELVAEAGTDEAAPPRRGENRGGQLIHRRAFVDHGQHAVRQQDLDHPRVAHHRQHHDRQQRIASAHLADQRQPIGLARIRHRVVGHQDVACGIGEACIGLVDRVRFAGDLQLGGILEDGADTGEHDGMVVRDHDIEGLRFHRSPWVRQPAQ